MMKANVYNKITDAVLELMEQHDTNWIKPFTSCMPHNAVSKHEYRGVNILMALLFGNGDNEFATFKQWEAKGCKIKKGSHGFPILFYKMLEKENDAGDKYSFPLAKYSTVFGASQVEGYEPEVIKSEVDIADEAEAVVNATGAKITHGTPCYIPSLDAIKMPRMDEFKATSTSTATECYYSTLFHELGHWTMHKSRCDRKADSYGFEELVAELTAVFSCVRLGISPEPRADHAKYLNNWKQTLKDDPKAIVKASQLAQKACDFIFDTDTTQSKKAA